MLYYLVSWPSTKRTYGIQLYGPCYKYISPSLLSTLYIYRTSTAVHVRRFGVRARADTTDAANVAKVAVALHLHG